jgi:serine/threonine-protein kinase
VGLPTEQPGTTRVVGRYALYGEIAAGGMATVHFGRLLGPVGFSRTVAIKRLHPQFAKDPEFVSMFLDEARVAARIRHPNVVPTLDVVATDGELFLVMDYVQGESLGRLVRALKTEGKTPPPSIIASILSGVLHGLHAAHEARNERGAPLGIVHRDVSPQNVLVGTDGVARVLDFGVAKATGRLQTTREGQIKGKLAYMPPEQLRGGELSRTTDIYAASVVLWESLTGQRLFSGDNEGAVFAKILEAPVEPPSKVTPGLGEAFDEVTLRGLSRDVAARWGTAREMALALERCIPLAPPSEVGSWVETLAKSVLTSRSERIAEIESSSSVKLQSGGFDEHVASSSSAQFLDNVRASHPPREPSARSLPGNETSSQLSSISVSKSGAIEREGGRRRRAVLVACALLAVGIIGFVAWRIGAPPAVAVAAAAPSNAPLPTPSAEPSAAIAPFDLPGSPSQAPSASVASVSSAPPVVRRPLVRLPVNNPRPPPAGPSKDCDPPYTLDAEGHKHYKLNCL